MYNLLPRLAPVLALAIVLGGFMAVDKVWLHWYAPDTSNFVRTPIQAKPTAAATSATPAPLRTNDTFAALWIAAQQTPYKVRYETSLVNGDKGASYVVFNKPPLGRVDTIPSGASQPFLQLFVDAEGKASRCLPAAGGRQCVLIDPFATALPLAAGPIVFPPATAFGSYDVTELDSRAFAGTPARCFHLAPTTSGLEAEADYCFSSNGAPVPVYGRGTFGVVEASEISSAVVDADFVALAPLPTPTGTTQGAAFTSVVTASPGGNASVTVQTTPNASCSIEYITPAGAASLDDGLVTKRADSTGAVSWSWRIGSRSSPGIGTVRVTCDGVQASTNISIR